MVSKAQVLAKQDDIEKIYLNKGLSNEVPLNGSPNRRPDLIVVRRDGKIDQYEVPSKSDDVNSLFDRMRDNQKILGERAGTINIEYID